jgi:glycosyltransferase involved in cell wall biosynthesis
MKDEGRHLAEWLAFHRAAGADHFLIYDNESSDDTAAIAARFERAFPGTVTVIPWRRQPPQKSSYKDAYRRLRGLTRWAAFIDADEFLFAPGGDLKAVLRGLPGEVSCLCVYWLMFGSSGHVEAPGGLCIEAFTGRAPDAAKFNRQYKAIVRPEHVVAYESPHRPLVLGRTVDETGQDIDLADRSRSAYGSHRLIRINHYVIKSRAEWRLKQARGIPEARNNPFRFRPDSFFTDHDRNEVRDTTAADLFGEQVKATLARLEGE